MGRNPKHDSPVDCSKQIRRVGIEAISLSGITLFGSLMLFVNTSPPMGEMGPFMHDSAEVMVPMSFWGVATGIGLILGWRWARISMLVFGGLLATSCTLLTIPFFLMSGGGMVWWSALAMRAIGVLLFLVPVTVGVRWFRFFLGSNVKAYFGISRRTPTTLA